MAGRETGSDSSLPFAALQLLAPPVRLVSAALWKAMRCRDVLQYGVLEEFVTSACETVPGLLTVRHQGKLALGLRGRMILELCRKQPDQEAIAPHLERIRLPAASSASHHLKRQHVKLHRAVENFHLLVRTLLTDAGERERFFKEDFPGDYGPAFDQELENLLWEFLIRLDQLLPVPSLARTVSWLSEAPLVLEECARSATQPQLLKVLLQHQACLGHLETAASLPPNLGDSILASLSLPPSGRAASGGARTPAAGTPDGTQTETPFITPVIGIISNEDVPVMTSAKRTLGGEGATKVDPGKAEQEVVAKPRGGRKRKQPDRSDCEEEEEEGEAPGEADAAREERANSNGAEDSERPHQGARSLPGETWLPSICLSRLNSRAPVVLDRIPAFVNENGEGAKSPHAKWRNQTRQRPPDKADSAFHVSDNKENRPTRARVGGSSRQQRSNAEMAALTGNSEDYVADSEDEATKNFKDRLFVKRYCRTKHGTYVPTLREYFRPRMARRDFLSTGGRRR